MRPAYKLVDDERFIQAHVRVAANDEALHCIALERWDKDRRRKRVDRVLSIVGFTVLLVAALGVAWVGRQ